MGEVWILLIESSRIGKVGTTSHFVNLGRAETVQLKDGSDIWSPPKMDPKSPSPIFGGSSGGLMRKAQIEEFYVITWESKKEHIFEMPSGGAAIMRKVI